MGQCELRVWTSIFECPYETSLGRMHSVPNVQGSDHCRELLGISFHGPGALDEKDVFVTFLCQMLCFQG